MKSPEMVVGALLKRMYPQNPDVVLGREARRIIEALREDGYAIVPDDPNHYVTFDESGWFIEHSVACRLAGTLGTCEFNEAIRRTAVDPIPEQFGRWRITGVDRAVPILVEAPVGTDTSEAPR